MFQQHFCFTNINAFLIFFTLYKFKIFLYLNFLYDAFATLYHCIRGIGSPVTMHLIEVDCPTNIFPFKDDKDIFGLAKIMNVE